MKAYQNLLDKIRFSIAVDGFLPAKWEAAAVVPGPGVRGRQPAGGLRQVTATEEMTSLVTTTEEVESRFASVSETKDEWLRIMRIRLRR